MFLIIPSMMRTRLQSVGENPRVSRLVEGRYFDRLVGVFLNDAQGILVRIKACHKDEGDVDTLCFVEVLDLLYDEVEKRQSVFDFKGALRGDACCHLWLRMQE